MKKKGLLLLTIFFSLCLGFTACSDDDDDGGRIEDNIFGVYKGSLDAEVVGEGLPGLGDNLKDIAQKVYVDKVSDNKVKISLKDFSVMGLELGNIEIQSADIENKGSDYVIQGSETQELDIVGTCKIDLKGTVKGNKITLDINVEVIGGDLKGLKVIVDFEGTKLDADQSSEAEILKITFDPEKSEANALVKNVEQNKTVFSLFVDGAITEEQKAQLIPTIEISEGAKISPESDKAQDFNKDVVYTVTSEDGIKTNKFTVRIAKTSAFFDFEEWIEDKNDYFTGTLYKPAPEGVWGTSNGGAALLEGFTGVYSNVTETEDAKNGKFAARMETLDSKGKEIFFGFYSPKITPASLFTGVFDLDMLNTLNSTKFGINIDKKPLKIKGYYKYTAGKDYYLCPNPKEEYQTAYIDNDKKDECSIAAYVYEYNQADEESEKYSSYLTGENIKTSDKIIARKEFASGSQTEYVEFTLELDYTKEFSKDKTYRLAIVMTSSKDGDVFSGAPGSTLYVDDVEIIYEE